MVMALISMMIVMVDGDDLILVDGDCYVNVIVTKPIRDEYHAILHDHHLRYTYNHKGIRSDQLIA
jgi:hypothetical protein